jgi:hypothetical protein
LAELFDFLAVFHIPQSHLSRNLLVHAYDGRHLLFREEKDLEHEMFAFIGAAAGHSCLPHEAGGEPVAGLAASLLLIQRREGTMVGALESAARINRSRCNWRQAPQN